MKWIVPAAIAAALISAGCKGNMKQEHTRELSVAGAYNIRDLGGYAGAGGKTVKWRTVMRSGDLNKLTDADLEYLASIPVVSYVDFRDSNEIKTAPDRRPATLKNDFAIPVEAGSVIELKDVRSGDRGDLLVWGNRMFVRDFQPEFTKFFSILSDPSNAPLLFHCSAGKDRTGYAAAMFLSALGVDRETVIEDYMLSAELLRDKYAADVKRYPELGPLMTVQRRYIEGAFEVIDSEYGGVENYLTQYLDVDLALMRSLYLE